MVYRNQKNYFRPYGITQPYSITQPYLALLAWHLLAHWSRKTLDEFIRIFHGCACVIEESVPIPHFFLAHLSRRLWGELLVYQWLHHPSVNIFKHLLWNHWANWTQISYGDSLGLGKESLFKWSWSHDQDGCMPIYGKNHLKIFSRTRRPMTLGLGM